MGLLWGVAPAVQTGAGMRMLTAETLCNAFPTRYMLTYYLSSLGNTVKGTIVTIHVERTGFNVRRMRLNGFFP